MLVITTKEIVYYDVGYYTIGNSILLCVELKHRKQYIMMCGIKTQEIVYYYVGYYNIGFVKDISMQVLLSKVLKQQKQEEKIQLIKLH